MWFQLCQRKDAGLGSRKCYSVGRRNLEHYLEDEKDLIVYNNEVFRDIPERANTVFPESLVKPHL